MSTKHVVALAFVGVIGLALLAVPSVAQQQQPAPVRAEVTGKAVVKTTTVEGVETKEVTILVATAKDAAGNAIANLAGKSLKVIGPRVADVEKLAGKDVIATGTLRENNTAIQVTSVKEKPAETPKPPA